MTQVSFDDYKFLRSIPSGGDIQIVQSYVRLDPNKPLETEVFLSKAMACRMEVEIVHVSPWDLVSLPKSTYGKTTVNYAGNVPMVAVERDQYENLQLLMPEGCVLEVVFNREIPGAQGRNRGAHGKKIIYICE